MSDLGTESLQRNRRHRAGSRTRATSPDQQQDPHHSEIGENRPDPRRKKNSDT